MNSDINIEKWARELGFEGVDDEQFRNSWKKLIPPAYRHIWRHFIKHILPAEKAKLIRKHYLLYKLENQKAGKHDIKANVQNFNEYEKYVHICRQKHRLELLNRQIDHVKNEVWEELAKLESISTKDKEIKHSVEDKILKSKLIDLKINAMEDEIDDLKKIGSVLDYYIEAPKVIPSSKESDRWDDEVVEYCKKLPKGQEIEILSNELKSLVDITLRVKHNNNSAQKDEVIQNLHILHGKKLLQMENKRKLCQSLHETIRQSKEELIKKFVEYHHYENSELLNGLVTSYIQNIYDNVYVKELDNINTFWKVNKDCSETEEYFTLQEQISTFDKDIENEKKSILKLMNGQEKLVKFCMNAVSSIKSESEEIISNMKADHKQLLTDMEEYSVPKEIELFLQLDTIRQTPNCSSTDTNLSVSETLKNLEKLEAIAQLKFELPNIDIDAENVISTNKHRELETELQLKETVERLDHLYLNIEKYKPLLLKNIEYWVEQPLAEDAGSEEYLMWRKRYKVAKEKLNMYNESI